MICGVDESQCPKAPLCLAAATCKAQVPAPNAELPGFNEVNPDDLSGLCKEKCTTPALEELPVQRETEHAAPMQVLM